MIRFHMEWQDAPGVRDSVLARTWCRLVIEAGGRVPGASGRDLQRALHLDENIDDDMRVGRAFRRVAKKGTTEQVLEFTAAFVRLTNGE